MRLLHLADLHLGWQPRWESRGGIAGLAAARDSILETAIGFALRPEHRVDAVLIAGDLFDTHLPPEPLVERTIAGLGRLVAAGVAVLTVPGNHDERTYPGSVYRRYAGRWPGMLASSPHLGHAGSTVLAGIPAHFYAAAYTGGLTRPESLAAGLVRAQGPGAHIAVLHGTVYGGEGLPASWLRDDRCLPLYGPTLAGLGFDYLALGHLHRAGPPAGWPPEAPACRYAGLVAGRGFEEPGCGHLTVVDLVPGSGTRVWLPEVSVPGFFDIEVPADQAQDQGGWLAAMERAVAGVVPPAAIRLRMTGALGAPVDLAALERGLAAGAGSGHWRVEVRDHTTVLGGDGLETWAGEPTVRGYFARHLLERLAAPGGDDDREAVERAWRYGAAALEGRGPR